MTYTIQLPKNLTIRIKDEPFTLGLPEDMPVDLVRHFAIFGLRVMMKNTVATIRPAPEDIARTMKTKLDYLIKIHQD